MFELNADDNIWIPTGKYCPEVYEFAGKVLLLANYFGMGANLNFNNDLSAFSKGRDALKFQRIEVHQVGTGVQFILKGKAGSKSIFTNEESDLYDGATSRKFFQSFGRFLV